MPNISSFNYEAQNRATNRENQASNHNSESQNQNTHQPIISISRDEEPTNKNVKTIHFIQNIKFKSNFLDCSPKY